MFVIEELFGFNEQTPRLWARDQVVSLVLLLVFTALIGAAVMAVVDAFPVCGGSARGRCSSSSRSS